jgi:hypothetical protein
VNRTPSSHSSPTTVTSISLRGRALVLASAEDLLDAFLFFYLRVPAALISWTMAQQAFNACMILLLDAMERMSVTPGAMKAEKAYVVFRDLQSVHTLASLAVERISWGLKKLHDVTQMSTKQSEQGQIHGNENNVATPWSEATHGLPVMCEDTVMNATGMFLLEDPGLQGFAPEAFAPISWNLGGVEPPMPFELKRERQSSHGGGLGDSPGSDEETDDVRSVGVMQGIRRSTTMRSAPTRYATPTLDDHPPLSVTAPTSHTTSSGSMQHQHLDSQTSFSESAHRHGHPPHLRHTQLCEENSNAWAYPSVSGAVDRRQAPYEGGSFGLHQGPVAQMRHNSCPSLHQAATAPPQARPTYSSPAAPRPHPPMAKTRPQPGSQRISDQASFNDFLEGIPHSTSPDTSPEGQPSWVVKATDRSANFQTQDPTMSCVLPYHVGHAVAEFAEGMAHAQSTGSAYPVHFLGQTPMSLPLGTEHMSIDEWKHWIGSGGSG